MGLALFISNRDVVDYIYRLIHNDCVLKLNQEYNHKRQPDTECVGYVIKCNDHGFLFNFRSDSDNQIYNYKYKHVTYCRLSKNYYHAMLYP